MTFDNAMAMVGTYLKNTDLSNSDNNDKFFYTILNDLREEFEPIVTMTLREAKTFVPYLTKDGVVSHKMLEYPDDLVLKGFTDKELAKASLFPEYIRIASDKEDVNDN